MKKLAFVVVSLFAASAFAQDAPVVSMESLLNLRFYDNQGKWLVENLAFAFPPADGTKGKVTLSKGGKVVSEVPVAFEKHYQFPAFAGLRPDGAPGFLEAQGSGDYEFSVTLGDKNIGAYRFSLTENKSKDPFKPGTTWVRKGAWGKLALVRAGLDRPLDPLRVGLWLNKLDLPGYVKGQATQLRITLEKGGKEVAYVEGASSDEEWTYYSFDLQQGNRQTHGPFKYSDLTKSPGAYSLRVKVKGAVAKEWKLNVTGSGITRIAQNKLDYKGADALCPQGMSVNNGTLMQEEQFWLSPVK